MQTLSKLFEVFSGRRVLVTGHTGFKGSWLSFWLHKMGAHVLGLSLEPPSEPSMYKSLKLDDIIDGYHVDINDFEAVKNAFVQFQPEVVLHLAAQSLVRPSYEAPLSTLHTNVFGTVHVLEACRLVSSVKALVIVTSDKCYRNNEWVWGYRENDPMGGHDPYSVSKGCAELITTSYIKSFFCKELYGVKHNVAVASARAGNAIGGGDWGKDRLIPDCFRALHDGRRIQIRFPKAVRPWQHVLECLSGYLLLASRLLSDGAVYSCGWNFAPIDMGDVWPVERVVKRICNQWGGGAYDIDNNVQPHEAQMLCLDCTKANIELGWHPSYKVAEALSETVDWYKMWSKDLPVEQLRDFTHEQIMRYVAANESRSLANE